MRYFLLLALLVSPLALHAQDQPIRAASSEPQPDDTRSRLGNFEIQDLMSRFQSGDVMRYDARPGLVRAMERNGIQRVASEQGTPILYASIRRGAIVDWIAVDQDGRFTPIQDLRTPSGSETGGGQTICWKCAQAGADIHCWQVDCPVLDAPSGGDD